ncbi:MAG: TRAP transporter small permease subunit [Rhodobacteraceae bacterium]|nr:TRAP transporter small permease subunit [Paracoccaceae bacterium]
MSEISTDTIDHVTKISDPGERNRESHLWGDRLMVLLGNIAAWLFPILMVAIVAQVFMRKFGFNQAWLDDAQWWIYGTALLTGFGYAITTNSHVRVDILHENYSPKKKARIELVALGWCLMPFLVLMADILTHYAYASIIAREGSDSPNGLHGLYLLKSIMPLLFIAAIIASFAALYRNLSVLRKPALWSLFIAAFPTVWFIAERVIYYILWWVVRLSNSEIADRRISREPLLEPTMWYGLAIVIIIAIASFVLGKRRQSEAA